jgi:hypothetical protein
MLLMANNCPMAPPLLLLQLPLLLLTKLDTISFVLRGFRRESAAATAAAAAAQQQQQEGRHMSES